MDAAFGSHTRRDTPPAAIFPKQRAAGYSSPAAGQSRVVGRDAGATSMFSMNMSIWLNMLAR
jgi:hypothetical protein